MPSRPEPNPWILCRTPRPNARLRLFCFPYAGGGVVTYRSWPDLLPADIEVCAVQLPGRDGRMREKPIGDMTEMVDELAQGLGPWLQDQPFAFFGHSMGALLSFEVTRHLRRAGRPQPVQLLVSARRGPQLPNPDAPCYNLPEPAFIDHLVKRYNGIPPAVLAEPELMQMFLPTLRADFRLMDTYRHEPERPLDQPVTVYGGLEDTLVSRADLSAWKEVAAGPFAVHMLAGGHFYLQKITADLLRLVARQLASPML